MLTIKDFETFIVHLVRGDSHFMLCGLGRFSRRAGKMVRRVKGATPTCLLCIVVDARMSG